jgi:hypothetical protein
MPNTFERVRAILTPVPQGEDPHIPTIAQVMWRMRRTRMRAEECLAVARSEGARVAYRRALAALDAVDITDMTTPQALGLIEAQMNLVPDASVMPVVPVRLLQAGSPVGGH